MEPGRQWEVSVYTPERARTCLHLPTAEDVGRMMSADDFEGFIIDLVDYKDADLKPEIRTLIAKHVSEAFNIKESVLYGVPQTHEEWLATLEPAP